MGIQEQLLPGLDAGVKGRGAAAAGLAHPGHLAEDALHAGGADAALHIKAAAPGGDDLGHGFQLDHVLPVGGAFDLVSPAANGGHGAGIRHGQLILAADAQGDLFQLRHSGVGIAKKFRNLIGKHHARGIAQRDHRGAGADGGADGLLQEGRIGPGGIVGNEFHLGAKAAALFHQVLDGGDHGLGLLAGQIFHLHGADRRGHLKAGMSGFLQGAPGNGNIFLRQTNGHGNGAAADGGADGLDQQPVDFGAGDRTDLNHVNPQLVQVLDQLDLLPEAQAEALAGLAHSHVGDGDFSHNGFSLSWDAKKPLRPD